MSKYLIRVDEMYRCDSELEAQQLIEEAKKQGTCELAKYTSVQKARKEKGEIVDEWTRVTLTKLFNNEKEPDSHIVPTYEIG